MCIIFAFISFGMAYMSFDDGYLNQGYGYVIFGLFLVGLMIRNIRKTIKEKREKTAS